MSVVETVNNLQASTGFSLTGSNVQYKTIGFVYNPKAAKGQGQQVFTGQIKPLIDKYLSDRTVKITPSMKEGGAIVCTHQLLKEGCDLVVACGGDGTIHEVVNALMDNSTLKARAAMAIIPMGTGNDFAKTTRSSMQVNNVWACNFEAVMESIQKGYTIQVDIGHLESTIIKGSKTRKTFKFFMNEASMGISGDVMETVNNQSSFWVSKDFTFQFQSVWKQFTYYNKPIQVSLDGKTQEILNQLVTVSNGQYFGSGMQINPSARLDDGKFSVCVFGDVGVRDMLGSILPNIYTGQHYKNPRVLFGECKSISLKPKNAEDKVFIECDGELSGQLPCTITNVPSALSLVVSGN